MGTDILHLRVKKDYAQQVLALLIKDDAIESVTDEEEFELTYEQKAQLDAELTNRANGKNEYKDWNDIKGKYGL